MTPSTQTSQPQWNDVYQEVERRYIQKKKRSTVNALLLLLPSLLFLSVFTIYPIASSFYKSLFKDTLSTATPIFIGVQNYIALFQDAIYQESFRNNLVVAFVCVPITMAMGVGMALWANGLKRFKTIARLGFIYPTFVPLVAAANIWLFIYTPIYGLLGYINPNWRLLASADTALGAVIAMLIWKQAGYLMLFYTSGLYGLPQEVLEAAQIDGAGKWKRFRHIIWPMLKPTNIYVFIIALTSAYKMVDHLYLMTKGGPGNATNVLLFYIYQTGFDYFNTGYASAMTVVLVGMLLVVSAVQFYYNEKNAYYN